MTLLEKLDALDIDLDDHERDSAKLDALIAVAKAAHRYLSADTPEEGTK